MSLRFLRAMLPFVIAGMLLTLALDHPAQRTLWLSLTAVAIIIAAFLQRRTRPPQP